MRKGFLILSFMLSFSLTACQTTKTDKGSMMASSEEPQVVSLGGALVSDYFEATPATIEEIKDIQVSQATQQSVIVECPACNQRIDVTGLPREQIRCPNCNSLFTY